MSDQRGTITLLLQEWQAQPSDASFQALLDSTYLYLKRIAANSLPKNVQIQRADLSPTVVVHEAFQDLRGLHQNKPVDRKHWYNICAKVFRSKIFDALRYEGAQKRGGNAVEIDIDEMKYIIPDVQFEVDELLQIDSLLNQLEQINEETAYVFSLRFYLGCSFPEIASLSKLSLTTVKRKWEFAKFWFEDHLSQQES